MSAASLDPIIASSYIVRRAEMTLPDDGDLDPPRPELIDPKQSTGYYHGGPAGLKVGGKLLPRSVTGIKPSAVQAAQSEAASLGGLTAVDVDPDDANWVFVTRHPWIAIYSTRRHFPSAVYEVRPEGEAREYPSSCTPVGDFLLAFERATILRRRWSGLSQADRLALAGFRDHWFAHLPAPNPDDAITYYNQLSIGIALLRERDYGLSSDLVRTLIAVWATNQAYVVLGPEETAKWWAAARATSEGRGTPYRQLPEQARPPKALRGLAGVH